MTRREMCERQLGSAAEPLGPSQPAARQLALPVVSGQLGPQQLAVWEGGWRRELWRSELEELASKPQRVLVPVQVRAEEVVLKVEGPLAS